MATEKWIAGSGQGLTFGNAFGTETNSLPATSSTSNSVLSSVIIDNTSALDMFIIVSFNFGSITTTGSPFAALYDYLQNHDGSYGDGRFTNPGSGPPPSSYFLGSAGAPVGTQLVTGSFNRPLGDPMILKPGKHKLVLYNGMGVALATSTSILYETFNRSVA